MATWSGIKKKLENDYLADSLKGRISYFATSYSYAPDHIGRASIKLDGVEILKSDYYKLQKLQWESYQELTAAAEEDQENSEIDSNAIWKQSWLEATEKGGFDNQIFYTAFEEFDNQSIEKSLESNNALVRILAVLDRRVGKRRLQDLAGIWKNEPEWIRLFLNLRLDAENMR